MGRRRIYASTAERCRAWRERRRAAREGRPARPPLGEGARSVVEWAATALRIPPGHALAGRPFRLAPWQTAFLQDALTHRESLLCVSRKNAKSALVAVLMLAHLAGPLRRAGWRAGVLSASREKAGELLKQIEAIAVASNLAGLTVRRSPWPGRVFDNETGAIVEIEGAGYASGHAAGYDFAVVDELGLLQERHRPMVAGMRSAGAAKNGRFLSLSIHGSGPFIDEILQRAGAPGLAIHHYHGDPDLALDDPANWKKANPGLSTGIVTVETLQDESARVLDTPSDQAYFRAHHLNLPGEPAGELIASLESWRHCETDDLPDRAGPCYLGIDLGATRSFTSAAAYWPESGRLDTWSACGTDPALPVRSRSDGVGSLYERAHVAGDLWLLAGRITPVGAFLGRLRPALAGESIKAIGCDRFRHAELLACLADHGLRWRPVWRGTGVRATEDAVNDIRRFQRAVEGRRLRVKPNLLLLHAMGESHIVRDATGRAIAIRKARQRSRIDSLQAAVIAVGLAPERNTGKRLVVHVA